MLVVGLKEMTTTKEVIQTLEQLLCDETSQLEDERNEVMHSRDTFQDLVRLMDQHRVERTVQLSILRQGVALGASINYSSWTSGFSWHAAFICPNHITLFTFSVEMECFSLAVQCEVKMILKPYKVLFEAFISNE